MTVVFLNYHYDADLSTPGQLIRRYFSSHEWCKSLLRAGAERVAVVQRFSSDEELTVDGIEYRFVHDGLPGSLPWWSIPRRVNRVVASLHPSIVHLNGRPLHSASLHWSLSHTTPIVWQHHGGEPPTGLRRWIHRIGFSAVDGVLVAAPEIALAWHHAGLISHHHAIGCIVESSSRFEPVPQETARKEFGIEGNPVLLWVGRLNENKDPLTVLRGFARILKHSPCATLYMIYTTTPLLGQCRRFVRESGLQAHVHFLGTRPHDLMPYYYSAADYFVLGSHHEGSGFALLEAISCGTFPLVTNIPTFRAITQNGTIGCLWDVGNPESLEAAFIHCLSSNRSRTAIRNFFETHLSFEVVGKAALVFYSRLLNHDRP
jgi:glycosyltransferase involved in cell wall biosynthesis